MKNPHTNDTIQMSTFFSLAKYNEKKTEEGRTDGEMERENMWKTYAYTLHSTHAHINMIKPYTNALRNQTNRETVVKI